MYHRDEADVEIVVGQFFRIHETVRLTLVPGEARDMKRSSVEGNALALGLGIGVVARALRSLGAVWT